VDSETNVTCFRRLVVPDNLWKVEKWNKKRVGTTDERIILFLVSASQSMTALNRPSHARRIVQSTGIVMAAILLSRLLGFLREWTVAHQIGSGKVTDAYYAAFTLPDVLNYMVASGSLGIIFIPIFTKYLAKNQEDEGWYVFSTVMTFMSLLLVGLVLLGEVFAPQLIRIIAPGFDPTEKARVVFLTRLMLPAQIFFYLGSVMASVQYAKGQFVMPSLAAVVYNLGIILGGWLLSSRMGITGFAVGVLAGTFCGYFLLQLIAVARNGARFTPNLSLGHPGFRLFLKLGLPIMLALSLVFTDEWIMRWFGSYLRPASITWLSYAKTLMRVPLGVVGQAVGIASFPLLARLYSEGRLDELSRTLNATIKALILLLVPISAFTFVLNIPLVTFVFSRTRLQEIDIQATAETLGIFSLGMFAWGAQNLLARGFYAARDTLTPAIIGTSITFLNIPVYWYCMKHWQHVGLAMASSIGMIAYAVIIFSFLMRRTKNREAISLVVFFLKVCAASVLASVACLRLISWLEERIAWHTMTGALLVLVIVSAVGFPLVATLASLFGVREVGSYTKSLLLRNKKRDFAPEL